jgi:hypothetical protein
MRYNPPPGWPSPPPGWTPPPGWIPDPSWPPLPPGWRLWLENRPARSWYGMTWVVVCALVLFFPLGLVLTWCRTDWSRARRAWITAVVAVMVMIAGAANSPPPTTSPVSHSVATPTASPALRKPSTRPTKAKPSRRPSVRRSSAKPRPTPHPVKKRRKRAVPTCGAPANPYGLNLCGSGRIITAPPSGVCDYFDCIDSFWNGHGYMVRCNDGEYSLSGGRRGTCSWHHGEGRPVRRR